MKKISHVRRLTASSVFHSFQTLIAGQNLIRRRMSINDQRELLDVVVGVEFAMFIAARVGGEAQNRTDEKTLLLMYLSAALAVLLHLEKGFLDQIFSLRVRPLRSSIRRMRRKYVGQPVHVTTILRQLPQSTASCTDMASRSGNTSPAP